MKEVFILSGARTAVGNFGGSLKEVPLIQLGSLVIREAVRRAGFRPGVGPELSGLAPDAIKDDGLIELEKKHAQWDESLPEAQVDEVIMGNVLQAALGQNPARQSTIYAGLPKETGAFTVNKVCASGLKAIALGCQAIQLGQAELVVAGGMENMSLAPYALPKARWGYRMDLSTRGELLDLMVHDGLWEIFYGYHMGNTAENIAERYSLSRKEQDEAGLLSHQRARKAIQEGLFKEEIVPVPIPQRKGDPVIFDTDERPMDTTLEKMAKLPPAFRKDGTVTAGNASGINDGAAAVVLAAPEMAKKLKREPLARIVDFASGATDPAYMGLGPIPAARKLLKAANLKADDIDVVELNEAFASQALACMRELGLSWDNTNPNGSGISLGHPIGCTGARLAVTIAHEMKRDNLKRGLITLCIGGGQGMAMLLEKP